MKIVRLKRAELTRWRQNQGHLVSDEGYLVSEVDAPLERAIATVVRSARSQRKTLEQRVAIGGSNPPREHLIVVRMERAGIDAGDFKTTVSVDGHRVVTGREVIAAEMLQEHGECQLRGPNGVILKVVRDPGVHRPTAKEAAQLAPHPDHCPCKTWGNPHPGTHYQTCEWNRLAPPEQRAPSDAIPETEVRMLPTQAFESLRSRPVVTAATSAIAARVSPNSVVVDPAPLDAPETCRNNCLEWATPKGFPIPKGQHHPTCQFSKEWAIKTTREIPRWLIDLRTGEKVRLASNDEIGQADVQAQRTGSPIIHIEETPYAVVLQTELDEEAAADAAAAGTAPAAPAAPAAAAPTFAPVQVFR